MAKTVKNKVSSDDFDIDSFLNQTDEFDSGSVRSHVDKRSGIKSFTVGSISGVKQEMLSGSFWARTFKAALPDEYKSSLEDISRLKSTLSSLFSDAVRDIKPGFQQLSRQVDKLVPLEQKRLKAFTTKLNNLTGGDTLSNNYENSEETNRDNTINSALGQIFALQAEENVRERARDNATKVIKEQTDLTRFNISTAILGNMGSNISRLVSYNEKINAAYQKKSLELQYRSIFLQTDQLNTSKTLLELLKQQNNELIRLGSMPDSEKALRSDSYLKSKKGIYGDKTGSIFGSNAYLDKVKERFGGLKNRAVGAIKENIEKALMGVDTYRDAIDSAKMMSDLGGSKSEMLGSLVGGLGFETIISHLVKKHRDKIIPKDSKLDNILGKIFAKSKDLPSLVKELSSSKYLKEDYEKYGTLKEKGKGFLRDILGVFSPDVPSMYLKTSKTSLGSLTTPATFDIKTYKSITTIIPGYLARIYRELQITRTGNKNIELTEFSYGKDRFTTSNKLAKEIDASIKKYTNSGSANYGKTKALENITEGTSLSEKAKDAISKRIEDIGFDPNLSISSKSFLDEKFLNSLPKDVAKEIKDSLGSKYNPGNNAFGRKENALAEMLDNYRKYIPDVRSNLEEVTNAGYGNILSKLGYVNKNKDEYTINEAKYKKLINEDSGDIIGKIKDLIDKGHKDILVDLGIVIPDKKDRNKYTYDINKYTEAVRNGTIDERIRTSDVHAKGNIRQTLGSKILSGIKKLKPNLKWNYKDGRKDTNEHVGPMAQDIKRNLGEEYAPGGTAIDVVSMNGASISAIKELALEQDKMKKSVGNDSSIKEILLSINSSVEKILENTTPGKFGINIGMGNLNMEEIKDLINKGKLKAKDLANQGSIKGATIFSILKQGISKGYMAGKSLLGVSYKTLKDKIIPYIKNTILPNTKEKALSGYGLTKSFLSSTSDTVHNTINPLKDIYVKGEESPVMFADLIRKGSYIDRDSKKVISTLSDIKGPVVSKEGNIIVSEADMLKGLVDVNGDPIRGLSTVLQNKARELISKANKLVTERLPVGIKQLYIAGGIGVNYIKNTINAPRDIYVVGGKRPKLYASVMVAGGYIDQKSGKVIKTIDDIKGQVVDDKGNIKLSFADIEKGLVDVDGKPIRSLSKIAKDTIAKGLSLAKNLASSLFSKAKNLFSSSKDKAEDILEELKKKNISGIHLGLGSSNETIKLLREIRNILKNRLPRSGGAASDHEGQEDESSPGFFSRGLSGIKNYLGKIKTGAGKIGEGLLKGTGAVLKGTGNLAGSALHGIGAIGGGLLKGTGYLAGSALHGVGKIGGGLLKGTGAILKGTGHLAGSALHGVGKIGGGLLKGTGAVLKGTGHLAGSALGGIGKIGGGLLKGTGAVLKGTGHLAGSALGGIGSMFRRKNKMSNVDEQEKENHEERLKEESNKAHASEKAKYLNGKGMFSGLWNKVKEFKGMLGKAFGLLGDIPFAGKLFKKIPILGKLFGGAKDVAAAGKVAEGAAVAGEAAEGAEAVAGGGGLLSGIGSLVSGGLSLGGSILGGIGGAVLDTTIAVGGAALGGIASILSSSVVLGAAVIGGLAYGGYKLYKHITRNNTDSLGKYRMAQYGLLENQEKYNHYILELEDFLIKNVVGYKKGQAYLIPNKLNVKTVLGIFGIDYKDKPALKAFIGWFNKRFKPVFLNTVSGLFTVNQHIRLTETSKLSKDEVVKLFPLIKFASGPYTVMDSPLISQGLTELSSNSKYVSQMYTKEFDKYSKTVKDNLAKDKKETATAAKGAIAATAAASIAASKDKKNKDKKETFLDKTEDTMKDIYSYTKNKTVNAYHYLKNKTHDTYKYIKTAISSAGVSALNAMHSAGKSTSQIKDMIIKIAKDSGIDPGIMLTIAAIESSFNPNARAGTSSAAGLYQFTTGTWDQMVREYGSKFGITMDTPRTDPKANTIMGAEFLKQNIDILKTVKPNPTPADVYLAHFLGAGGAKEILTADPSATAASILPSAARANTSLFYRGGQALTVQQFYEGIASLVSTKASRFGINIAKPQLTSGGKKSPVVLSNNNTAVKTTEATKVPSKNLINNIDPLTTKAVPVKPANNTVAVNKPVPSPQTVRVIRKPENTENGQGFHMQKVHEGLSDVSSVLSESLLVQKQMLEGINKLASNTKQSVTTDKNTSVAQRTENKPAQVPKPAVSLNRNS